MLADRIEQLRDRLAAHDLDLRVEMTSGPTLLMDANLADSLVHNLLQNALKHNQHGGFIRVTLNAEAIEVGNTGPATAGDPSRFFERFCKHNAASDSPGLGLSIVRQICQLYGFTPSYDFAPADSVHKLRVDFGQKTA